MAAGIVSLLPKFNVGMEQYPEFLRKEYHKTHTRQRKRKRNIRENLPFNILISLNFCTLRNKVL